MRGPVRRQNISRSITKSENSFLSQKINFRFAFAVQVHTRPVEVLEAYATVI